MLEVYGLNKCSTCQKARAWLDDHGIAYHFTDVHETPLTEPEVTRWMRALGGWEKLVNRAGYTWRGLSADETLDLRDAGARALIVKYSSLMRRPLIDYPDGTVTVGFSARVQEGLQAHLKP